MTPEPILGLAESTLSLFDVSPILPAEDLPAKACIPAIEAVWGLVDLDTLFMIIISLEEPLFPKFLRLKLWLP